jgi:flagellar biosynthesis anti-sigma factor FlgM
MRISDQGFTERLPGQAQTDAVDSSKSRGSTAGSRGASGSDTLQLSNFAAQLQQASTSDTTRSARVSAIASAVKNNTFQIDPSRVSSAMVSEAIQGRAS